MKKMPIYILLLLLLMMVPFFMLAIKTGSNTELSSSKNKIIENYSDYEDKLLTAGYRTDLTSENGENLLVVYTDSVTYTFDKLNACTAEFSNKDVASQKYTCKMYSSNIGESNISVTLTETYQGRELDYSCNYSSEGFGTLIDDISNYDENDREIKSIISEDYKLSVIYAQMQEINSDLIEIISESNSKEG